MSVKTYGRTALIGGASGALDEFDADNLNEGDRCLTILSTGEYYFHRLNASSGAAESSPDVVKPDSGGGTSPYTGDKRWILAELGASVDIAPTIHGASAKTTPVDADEIALIDSAASWVLKKLTWTNIKATLKTYFDTLYNNYSHPNHTGPVTSSGDGATAITDKAVTLAKMNDMATASLLGRNTAAVGVPEVLSKATVQSLLNVENNADVTDAVNVGSSIHGVANKATPVNADKVPLIDTVGGNILKTSTWTNIKAFLKTYFDTLYNNYSLENHAGNHTNGTDDVQTATNAQKGLMPSGVKDGYDDAVTKKHTQGTDTALGAQAENLDMNTHKIVGVVDPTANQDAATKKYVDDNAGGSHALVAKTANYNVLAADLVGLKTFTNDGAAGEITFTLPAGVVNYRVGFIVTDAQYLKVTANGTEKFRYGATQGAAGGYIRYNVVGTAWTITWTADDWLISPLSGILKYDE